MKFIMISWKPRYPLRFAVIEQMMKASYAVFAATLSFVNRSSVEMTNDKRRIESAQVALWEQKLTEARKLPPEERPAQLWLGLRNMGHRNAMDGRDPNVQVIYQKIQEELLSIPGHARYFADEIKRKQKEVAGYPTNTGPRVSYDFNRSLFFRTMAHLPSPETIAVLGEFLSDDIDTPRIKISPNSDWGENPRANSFASTSALSAIGLREPPASTKSYDADPEAHLAKSRAWWEEVKSGRKTFSFVGQKMEYRFKRDGSWDAIPIANPTDDAPAPAAAADTKRPDATSELRNEDSNVSSRGPAWWVYGGSGLTLLIVGVWLWRIKGTR